MVRLPPRVPIFLIEGEHATLTNCSTNYKFAGYEQDSETGLYYAFARYYNPRLGRFMSADPLGGNIGDPQSLNRYAYVANNPVNLIDPHGLEFVMKITVTDCDPYEIYISGPCAESPFVFPSLPTIPDGFFGGGGGDLSALLGNPAPFKLPPPNCSTASLDDPNLFWADNFATPQQVDSYFQSQNGPGSWDGWNAAQDFIGKGINPGLAVGIVGAETSFGNGPVLSANNINNPFSCDSSPNFNASANCAANSVAHYEDMTYTDNTPLTALINRQNPPGYAYEGDLPPTPQNWLNAVNDWFRKFAKFLGKCQ